MLHATPVFGSQQEDSKELHEDYVRKELRRKDAVYYSSDFVGAEKLLFVPLSSSGLGLQGNVDCIIKTARGEFVPAEYKNMNSDRGKVCIARANKFSAVEKNIPEISLEKAVFCERSLSLALLGVETHA